MMDFMTFARAHGVLIRDLWADGRIHRVPTAEKPRKRNGAYRFTGEWGWVQSWDSMVAPAVWKHDIAVAQPVRYKTAPDDAEERRRAAERAREMVARCTFSPHPYLARKGLESVSTLVDAEGRIVVPMRSVTQYGHIQSVQWIDAEGNKRFLPGGAAKGAVYRIGSGTDLWLCEGYATGLSMAAALKTLYWPATVVVCFSAGNLAHIASLLRGRRFVMADNDVSGTGERVARDTGLRWVMPAEAGTDANDLHVAVGLRAVAALMGGARL